MIEAVNSVVSNAPALRASVEQVDVARVAATQDIKAVASAPQAPYVSPYIFVDVNYNKAVLQIRDSDTGDVLKQFPSEPVLRARQYESVSPVSFEKPESSEAARVSAGESTPLITAQAQVAAAALSTAQTGAKVTSTLSITA